MLFPADLHLLPVRVLRPLIFASALWMPLLAAETYPVKAVSGPVSCKDNPSDSPSPIKAGAKLLGSTLVCTGADGSLTVSAGGKDVVITSKTWSRLSELVPKPRADTQGLSKLRRLLVSESPDTVPSSTVGVRGAEQGSRSAGSMVWASTKPSGEEVYQKGLAHFRAERYADALSNLNSYLETQKIPRDAAWYFAGAAALSAGDEAQYTARLDAARQRHIEPKVLGQLLFHRADWLFAQGRYAAAIAWCDKARQEEGGATFTWPLAFVAWQAAEALGAADAGKRKTEIKTKCTDENILKLVTP